MIHLLLVAQLWVGFPISDPKTLLNGSWQSCRDGSGVYGEKVYDRHETRGGINKWVWSLHLGPYHEFALYTPKDDPTNEFLDPTSVEEHSHEGKANLLAPDYHVVVDYGRGKRTWSIPSLGLWVNIVLAGGSREECESFVILIRRHP